MLQITSYARVVDNSGGKIVKCLKVKKGSGSVAYGLIGNFLVVSIMSSWIEPSDGGIKSKKHAAMLREFCYALVIRSRHGLTRRDGCVVRFGENDVLLLNRDGTPKGTRVLGFVPFELRFLKCMRAVSLSSGTI